MNITKTQFTQIIDAVIEQQNRDQEISKSLDEVLSDGDSYPPIFRTPLLDSIVKTLDHDDIITWWMWDGPEHGEKAEEYVITLEDGCQVAIHDAGELYDFMEGIQK